MHSCSPVPTGFKSSSQELRAGMLQIYRVNQAMRDAIQKVIATEAEAKQKVQAARSESELISSGARKHAQELVTMARQTARLETDKMLATALQAAEVEKQRRLAHATAEIETQINVEPATLRQAAEMVTRCVCGFRQ
jgi:vacuolar-type H+-ATPase subunit H